MSLIGKTHAIISLGMSCQTAWQIDAAVGLLQQLSGDKALAVKSCPFDWLVVPPAGVSSMLKADQTFPSSASEVEHRYHPYWPAGQAYLQHNFKEADFGDFDDAKGKADYLLARLHEVAQIPNIICVVANTQDNLCLFEPDALISINARASELNNLQAAAGAFFGRPVKLLFVGYRSRYVADADPHFKADFLPEYAEDWRGDQAGWSAIWRRYFGMGQGLF